MPKVGNKEFSYSPEGIEAAKQESILTGQPMADARNRQEITLGYGENIGEEIADTFEPMTENAFGQIEGKVYKK